MKDARSLYDGDFRRVKTAKTGAIKRAWIRCPSGRRVDLMDPSPIDIEITDIAQSLSRIARWAGMTRTKYGFSVAQHCVMVVDFMQWIVETSKEDAKAVKQSKIPFQHFLLAGLCHDAPEAYLGGDLAGPAKAALPSKAYKFLEEKLEEAVHLRLGLPVNLPSYMHALIKKADKASAYAEACLVAGFSRKEAKPLFGIKTALKDDAVLETWAPEKAEKEYLQLYEKLKIV